jgi:GT2 family glycosyltransferase
LNNKLVQAIKVGIKMSIACFRGHATQSRTDSTADDEPKPLDAAQSKNDEVAPPAVLASKLGLTDSDYQQWIKNHQLKQSDIQRIKRSVEVLTIKPKFLIVLPVLRVDERWLVKAINSVRHQLYPYWELCLLNSTPGNQSEQLTLNRFASLDERIFVHQKYDPQRSDDDLACFQSSDYIAHLGPSDELSTNALYENAKVIAQYPEVGFIYSDEDSITDEQYRIDPFFKPSYSPDLLDAQNYACRFSVTSKQVVNKVGGLELFNDRSPSHEFVIRAAQYSSRVVHIPQVLYHHRKTENFQSNETHNELRDWQAERKLIEACMFRRGERGRVIQGKIQGTFQLCRDIIGNPKVSIIIPFKDRVDLLKTCLDSILTNTGYNNYEVVGVSNSSKDKETFRTMSEYSNAYSNIRFIEKNEAFNFSSICNFGVANSTGEYVILLNNDIQIKSYDWIKCLLEHAQRDDVGAVGGKLYFADGRIQHAGIVAGMHGVAGHSHQYFAADDNGYFGGLMLTREVSAVTGAMLMVSRAKYHLVSGLDANNLAVAYSDVDLCFKLLNAGYRNIFTPYAQAVHFESASRGYEDTPEKLARLQREQGFFINKWRDFLTEGDRYFNPNFDLACYDYSLKL